MKVIFDRTGLNESFSRMVDPTLTTRDRLAADAGAQDGLKQILSGDRVGVSTHCPGDDRDLGFSVIRAQTITGTGVDIYGVCHTNAAGRADLVARGLLAPGAVVHDLLGAARTDAAERNSTESRRALKAWLQVSTAEESQTGLQLADTMPRDSRDHGGPAARLH